MIIEELRAAVLAVPGVADVEVAIRHDDTPVVRVWTDGSRNDGEVQHDVADVIAIHGYGTGAMDMGMAALQARIVDSVGGTLPDEAEETIWAGHESRASTGLAKLIIEETGDSVVAVASDAAGRTARAIVGDGPDAFLEAVAEAVAALRGVTPTPVLVNIEDRLVAGVDVVSVLIENGDGERFAGAAVVRGGLPFSFGRAVDAALANSV